MSRALALALLAAASPAFADGPFFASRNRLSSRRGFGRHGVMTRIAAGGRSIDLVRFVVPDSKGHLLVAGITDDGESSRPSPRFARLSPEGELDPSFGVDGIAEIGRRGDIESFTLDAEDRPVLTGVFEEPSDGSLRLEVVRLTPRGALDTRFSDDGAREFQDLLFAGPHLVAADQFDSTVFVTTSVEGPGIVRFDSDGRRVVGWFAETGDPALMIATGLGGDVFAGTDCCVERFDAAGSRDMSFGTNGVLVNPAGSPIVPRGLAVAGDGRIVVFSCSSSTRPCTVFRFLGTGVPDGLFCEGGVASARVEIPPHSEIADDFLFAASRDPDAPYVIAAPLFLYREHPRRFAGHGACLRAIDPAAPASVDSFVKAGLPGGDYVTSFSLNSAAVSRDGRTAYAAGGFTVQAPHGAVRAEPYVLAVDLVRMKTVPLPDLSIAWRGRIRVEDVGGGHRSVDGRLVVTNSGRGRAGPSQIELFLSAGPAVRPSDPLVAVISIGPIAPRSSRTFPFRGLEVFLSESTTGRRLVAVANSDGAVLETDPENVPAASEPVE